MPHIIIEYSFPLEERVDIGTLTKRLHSALSAQRSFDMQSMKSRAKSYDHFNVTTHEGRKDFLHIQLRVFEGRAHQDLVDAVKNVGATAVECLPTDVDITVELVEMKKDLYYKRSS